VGVALPGNVVAYADGFADIRPGVRRLAPSETAFEPDYPEEIPVIPSVPVIWPRGRNFRIVGELGVGDPVLLVCADYDISGWLRSGKLSDPEDAREHSWGHGAVCIPGLIPDVGWSASAPADAAALASVVDAFGNQIAGLTPPTNPAETQAAVAFIIAAFNLAMNGVSFPSGLPSPSPTAGTCASDTLLTDS